MAWCCQLSAPIVLDDGRTFLRLRNAATTRSRKSRADFTWLYAAKLTMAAAWIGSHDTELKKAEDQLDRAIRAEAYQH